MKKITLFLFLLLTSFQAQAGRAATVAQHIAQGWSTIFAGVVCLATLGAKKESITENNFSNLQKSIIGSASLLYAVFYIATTYCLYASSEASLIKEPIPKFI